MPPDTAILSLTLHLRLRHDRLHDHLPQYQHHNHNPSLPPAARNTFILPANLHIDLDLDPPPANHALHHLHDRHLRLLLHRQQRHRRRDLARSRANGRVVPPRPASRFRLPALLDAGRFVVGEHGGRRWCGGGRGRSGRRRPGVGFGWEGKEGAQGEGEKDGEAQGQ